MRWLSTRVCFIPGHVSCFLRLSEVSFSCHFVYLEGKEWKPRIDYYDFYTQSTEKMPIRQTFPYVKVCIALSYLFEFDRLYAINKIRHLFCIFTSLEF